MSDEHWMLLAIETARRGIEQGQTPFGACIVRGDDLIVAAHNLVWRTTDVTAHAEVTAIREACRALGAIDLTGCAIYSTCEPCPMCFSACHWARLDRIVFGASIADASAAGFNELPISNDQLKRLANTPIQLLGGILREKAADLFHLWLQQPTRRGY